MKTMFLVTITALFCFSMTTINTEDTAVINDFTIQGNGDIYVNGSKKGEIQSDGDVYIGGSKKGEIQSDGDIYIGGSKKGEVQSDGDVYIGGSKKGEVQSDGDVYFGGSKKGECEGVRREWVAAVYFFFFTREIGL